MQPKTKNENNKTNTAVFFLIIPSMAREISKRKKISLQKSNEMIYKSKLYKELEKEDNKLWYYSYKDLVDFLLEEQKIGEVSISEV